MKNCLDRFRRSKDYRKEPVDHPQVRVESPRRPFGATHHEIDAGEHPFLLHSLRSAHPPFSGQLQAKERLSPKIVPRGKAGAGGGEVQTVREIVVRRMGLIRNPCVSVGFWLTLLFSIKGQACPTGFSPTRF